MVAFYIWFAYKSCARRQSVRWLPESRDSWWRVSIIALFAVMGYQLLFMYGMKFTAAGRCFLDHNDEPDLHSTACGAFSWSEESPGRMVYGLVISFVGVVDSHGLESQHRPASK